MRREESAREAFRLASLLLQYPDAEIHGSLPELERVAATLREQQRGPLLRFLAGRRGRSLRELQQEYVATFDTNRKASLYVTYPTFGDRRERGMELLKLHRVYRASGLRPDPHELPDFLPTLLEFAWLRDEGRELLSEHRPAIALLAAHLGRSESPYAGVVDAVLSGLPRLAAAQRRLVRRLLEGGPPAEQVGLEPFAPPDVMPRIPVESSP